MGDKLLKKKVNLLGDPAVGKTSLILKFVKNIFGEEYLKTIGSNVYSKEVEFSEGKVKLIIYDIMGKKDYEAVKTGAFTGSTGAIAISDLTRLDTMKSLKEEWVPKYKKIAGGDNPIIPVVNKFDLIEEAPLDEVSPSRLSNNFEKLIFTSAKTGRNVEYVFSKLAREVALNLSLDIEDAGDIIKRRSIETTGDLLDALFLCGSDLGNLSQPQLINMLEKSGIPRKEIGKKFEFNEDKIISFGNSLKSHYEEEGDRYSASVVKKVLDKYKSDERPE
ncbi:MAG: GTP-binding protein [Candidatus Aenigmatarchaeota archaeon]